MNPEARILYDLYDVCPQCNHSVDKHFLLGIKDQSRPQPCQQLTKTDWHETVNCNCVAAMSEDFRLEMRDFHRDIKDILVQSAPNPWTKIK